jgi:streptomycin 6-kinase
MDLWELTPDGPPIMTPGARLIAVRRGQEPAMLKIATEAEEKLGGILMTWWDGQGAARVLEHNDDAILLERATGIRSLSDMARTGDDGGATAILCDALAALHAPRAKPWPELLPLSAWFRDLEPVALSQGGFFARAHTEAARLLNSRQDIVALHGDIHHDNVLDFGARGWLAIDPKRLLGERGFDYANIFCNPDLADPAPPVAVLPERFHDRLRIVTERSGLDRRRLLQWILAWAGLSAAWFHGDNVPFDIEARVAELAAAELDR